MKERKKERKKVGKKKESRKERKTTATCINKETKERKKNYSPRLMVCRLNKIITDLSMTNVLMRTIALQTGSVNIHRVPSKRRFIFLVPSKCSQNVLMCIYQSLIIFVKAGWIISGFVNKSPYFQLTK